MPNEFEKAFAEARSKGLAEFTFNGKQYNTQLKEEPSKLLQVSPTDEIRQEMKSNPSLKYVSNYNTGLNKQEFNEFWDWATKRYGNKDRILREMGNYDLQGAWRAIKNKEIDFDPETGHLTDEYKKPNHITFSNESKYHDDKNFIGGQWSEAENNRWKFKPSKQTLDLYGKRYLQRYFSEYEKDVDLQFD